MVTGDGDALSIGGNHLIHALRRNVNLKILLFNNRIYGLTKGQYSPTSEIGKVTKSTPMGSLDHPFNPVSLALGAEATFVARTMDSDRKHLTEVLRAGRRSTAGTALVEIYQNCNIFNDGAFDAAQGPRHQGRLDSSGWSTASRCGSAPTGDTGVVRDPADRGARVHSRGRPRRRRPETPARRPRRARRRTRPTRSRCPGSPRQDLPHHAPIGVFRPVERPTYDDLSWRAQLDDRAGGQQRRRATWPRCSPAATPGPSGLSATAEGARGRAAPAWSASAEADWRAWVAKTCAG